MALSSAEMDHQYRMEKLRSRTSIIRAFIRLVAIIAVAVCAVFLVRSLAGRQTFADVKFAVIADLRANRFFALTVSWLLTGSGLSWAVVERKLRKRVTKRLTNELQVLQLKVDPKKRSSGLLPNGNTRPEDE